MRPHDCAVLTSSPQLHNKCTTRSPLPELRLPVASVERKGMPSRCTCMRRSSARHQQAWQHGSGVAAWQRGRGMAAWQAIIHHGFGRRASTVQLRENGGKVASTCRASRVRSCGEGGGGEGGNGEGGCGEGGVDGRYVAGLQGCYEGLQGCRAARLQGRRARLQGCRAAGLHLLSLPREEGDG